MVRLVFLFLVLFSSFYSFAQKDTLYFDAYGHRVNENVAKHYRLPYTKEGEKYKVVEYYMDGQLHLEGYSRSLDTLIWEGTYVKYYANGRKEAFGNYINGYQVGTWKLFYEDTSRVWAVSSFNPAADTLEVLRSFYRSGKVKRIEYRVKNKGKEAALMNSNGFSFSPTGVCYDELGGEIPFTPFEKLPEFKMNVNMFLAKTIRYPADAVEAWKQGQVLVSFIVKQDGKIDNITTKASSSVFSSLVVEAARVVKMMSGDWEPGMQDDEPVKVSYTIPVMFNLR